MPNVFVVEKCARDLYIVLRAFHTTGRGGDGDKDKRDGVGMWTSSCPRAAVYYKYHPGFLVTTMTDHTSKSNMPQRRQLTAVTLCGLAVCGHSLQVN